MTPSISLSDYDASRPTIPQQQSRVASCHVHSGVIIRNNVSPSLQPTFSYYRFKISLSLTTVTPRTRYHPIIAPHYLVLQTKIIMSGGNNNYNTISSSERQYIVQGCREQCRRDGRTCHEFRPYHVVAGSSNIIVPLSYGSARVFLPSQQEATHLVVSVKAELVVPASVAPDEGVVEVSVDFLNDNDNSHHTALETTLSSLLVPHLVDPRMLCIAPEYYVWRINIDILVIAGGGGSLLDACSQGIHAALGQTLLPRLIVTKGAAAAASGGGETSDGNKPTLQVDSNIQSARPILSNNNNNNSDTASAAPVIVTISLLRDPALPKRPILIVDATAEEEACSFAQVHVVVQLQQMMAAAAAKDDDDEPMMICALHKAGGGALPFALLQEVTQFCLEASGAAARRMVVKADALAGMKEPAVFECAA